MTTSRDVFAKRKAGQLDEAYQLALQLVNGSEFDEWNFKAFAWCLVDLIKRDSKFGNQEYLAHYAQQLQSVDIESSDEILSQQARYVLSLCNNNGQLISQAKSLSKQGNHQQAANIYRNLCDNGAGDQGVQTSLGWELYRLLKQVLSQDHLNLSNAKRLLSDYLNLNELEKPSLLHSCILQLAVNLAGHSSFDLLAFVKFWRLEYLREEDFQPYINERGEKYPSLAEKVIQQAAKEAVVANNIEHINYILPHIDAAIERFPENIWLELNKTKALLKLNRNDEALQFATDVTRAKINDYWAWALLGDVNIGLDISVAQSCYCKALLCHTDDKFTSKLRMKLAQLLVSQGEFAAAKYEVERIVIAKGNEGGRLPEDVLLLQETEWYRSFTAAKSNKKYYQSNVAKAEQLLCSKLPFVNACVGETFTIPDNPHKPKRKLYIKVHTESEPFEFEYAAILLSVA